MAIIFRSLPAILASLALALALARARASSGPTGDSKCVPLMCISALVFPNATTQYTLTSTGASPLGWIAMGFGSTMANSPMVIMWPNPSDGSVTLSQRMAPAEVMPTVVASPPRQATFDLGASNIAAGTPKPALVYTVPSLPAAPGPQAVIWAFATAPPGSSSPAAPLLQHLDSGTFTLDLARPLPANASAPASTAAGGETVAARDARIVQHAVLCTIGFLALLPLGVLVARWLRTVPAVGARWFTAHWVVQCVLSGPVIVAGVALGIRAVDAQGGMHLNDTHKKLGIALFVLYFAQLTSGAVIHFFKFPARSPRRPAQNYLHALTGLLLIALAAYQARTGYRREYPEMAGRAAPRGVGTLWVVWAVIIPVAYFAGLSLLPRQFRQECRATGGGKEGACAEERT